jgi:hypothetical protein
VYASHSYFESRSGLIKDFYLPRWELFISYLQASVISSVPEYENRAQPHSLSSPPFSKVHSSVCADIHPQQSLASHTPFNTTAYEEAVQTQESNWTTQLGTYPTTPTGDSLQVCLELFEKYRNDVQKPRV